MSHEDQPSDSIDRLERATEAMRSLDVSDVPDEVVGRTGSAMRRTGQWRKWRSHAIAKRDCGRVPGTSAGQRSLVAQRNVGVGGRCEKSRSHQDVACRDR